MLALCVLVWAQGIKRKWEGFTGAPLPIKKLKTTSSATLASASSAVHFDHNRLSVSTSPSERNGKTESNNACVEKEENCNINVNKKNKNDDNSMLEENNNNNSMDEVEVDVPPPKIETAVAAAAAATKPGAVATPSTETTTTIDNEATTTNCSHLLPQLQQLSSTQPATTQLPNNDNEEEEEEKHLIASIDVNNLKWNELRKIVKQYGLSTAGRKFELQERLKNYLEEKKKKKNDSEEKDMAEDEIMEEMEKKDEEEKNENNEIEKVVARVESDAFVKNNEEEENVVNDVVMEDISDEKEKPVLAKSSSAVEATSLSSSSSSSSGAGKVRSIVRQLSAKNETMMASETMTMSISAAKKVKEESDNNLPTNATMLPPMTMMKEPPKSALKPSKYAPTSSSSIIQTTSAVDRAVSSKNLLASLKKEDLRAPSLLTSTSSTANTNMTSSKLEPNSVQKTKMISSIIEETCPDGYDATSSSFKAAKIESAKLQEKKKNMAAASEARKARLAEMREKVSIHVLFLVINSVLCLLSHPNNGHNSK